MSKVVSIDGNEVKDGREPVEYLVKTLEDLLEMARSGELVGISAVCSYFDGSGQTVRSGRNDTAPVVGRLNILAFDLMRESADD
ncbi:hypothetical protein ACTOV4_00580 [Brucella sp. C7-11G]